MSGAGLAKYLGEKLNGKGRVLMMTGIPGVSTSDIMEAGGKATFKNIPESNLSMNSLETGLLPKQSGSWKHGLSNTETTSMESGLEARKCLKELSVPTLTKA